MLVATAGDRSRVVSAPWRTMPSGSTPSAQRTHERGDAPTSAGAGGAAASQRVEGLRAAGSSGTRHRAPERCGARSPTPDRRPGPRSRAASIHAAATDGVAGPLRPSRPRGAPGRGLGATSQVGRTISSATCSSPRPPSRRVPRTSGQGERRAGGEDGRPHPRFGGRATSSTSAPAQLLRSGERSAARSPVRGSSVASSPPNRPRRGASRERSPEPACACTVRVSEVIGPAEHAAGRRPYRRPPTGR
jgi:hypothetical protein